MINNKRNHHFVAQVEQVFHTRSVDVKSRRINRFEVIGKSKKTLKKTTTKNIKIANNLSWEDLYCFDFLSREQQYNFEDTFGRYESNYKNIVDKITNYELHGNKDCFVLDLFTYKWMSIIRNPFCIKETLSMFGELLKLIPTDPELLEIYNRIERGCKPQKQRVCEYFGITEIDYTNWLKVLFLALSVNTDGSNILESCTRAIFYGKDSSLNIFIFSFSNEYTVLSDVGFTSTKADTHLTYDFPLTDTHFISFAFTNLESFTKSLEEEHGISLTHILNFISNKPKEVKVVKYSDDLPFLSAFNARMVNQSNKYVFSKSSKPYFDNT